MNELKEDEGGYLGLIKYLLIFATALMKLITAKLNRATKAQKARADKGLKITDEGL